MTDRDTRWPEDEVRPLLLERIDERLHRYRLAQPRLEKSMAQSLERYGQVSPIVICVRKSRGVPCTPSIVPSGISASSKGVNELAKISSSWP